MIMILTGTLLLSMSGYFRNVWIKNLPGEKVFWNIVISLMRNFRRAVLGGWFIQVVACNHGQMWRFHEDDSDRSSTSEHVRIPKGCLEKEPTRRNSVLNHRNQSHEKFFEDLCLEVDSFRWLLVIIVKCEVFMMMILTGHLLLSKSGYFRDDRRKNLPGETVFETF